MISSRLASLAELSTAYGLEGLYDLVEVIVVDAHNRRLMQEASQRE